MTDPRGAPRPAIDLANARDAPIASARAPSFIFSRRFASTASASPVTVSSRTRAHLGEPVTHPDPRPSPLPPYHPPPPPVPPSPRTTAFAGKRRCVRSPRPRRCWTTSPSRMRSPTRRRRASAGRAGSSTARATTASAASTEPSPPRAKPPRTKPPRRPRAGRTPSGSARRSWSASGITRCARLRRSRGRRRSASRRRRGLRLGTRRRTRCGDS